MVFFFIGKSQSCACNINESENDIIKNNVRGTRHNYSCRCCNKTKDQDDIGKRRENRQYHLIDQNIWHSHHSKIFISRIENGISMLPKTLHNTETPPESLF